jgi:hypothetical protein
MNIHFEKILIAPYQTVRSLLSAPFTAGWISARYIVPGHSCLCRNQPPARALMVLH